MKEWRREFEASVMSAFEVMAAALGRDYTIVEIEDLLTEHLSGLRAEATKLKEVANRVTQFHAKRGDPGKILDAVIALAPEAPPAPPLPARVVANAHTRPQRAVVVEKKQPAPSLSAGSSRTTNGDLKPAHLRLLAAIAWWEGIGVAGPDLGGVAFVAGTSTKSSAFDNNRSWLRARGYVHYPQTGRVCLTPAGRAIAPPPPIPATSAALHDAILGKITPAHGRMLRVLIAAYPDELALEEFASRSGTSTTSSAFDNNRSWLRARGLAEYPRTGYVRATQLLFPEAP